MKRKEGGKQIENEFEQLKIWLQATTKEDQSMRSKGLGLNTETIVYKLYDLKFHAFFVKTFCKIVSSVYSTKFSYYYYYYYKK